MNLFVDIAGMVWHGSAVSDRFWFACVLKESARRSQRRAFSFFWGYDAKIASRRLRSSSSKNLT